MLVSNEQARCFFKLSLEYESRCRRGFISYVGGEYTLVKQFIRLNYWLSYGIDSIFSYQPNRQDNNLAYWGVVRIVNLAYWGVVRIMIFATIPVSNFHLIFSLQYDFFQNIKYIYIKYCTLCPWFPIFMAFCVNHHIH